MIRPYLLIAPALLLLTTGCCLPIQHCCGPGPTYCGPPPAGCPPMVAPQPAMCPVASPYHPVSHNYSPLPTFQTRRSYHFKPVSQTGKGRVPPLRLGSSGSRSACPITGSFSSRGKAWLKHKFKSHCTCDKCRGRRKHGSCDLTCGGCDVCSIPLDCDMTSCSTCDSCVDCNSCNSCSPASSGGQATSAGSSARQPVNGQEPAAEGSKADSEPATKYDEDVPMPIPPPVPAPMPEEGRDEVSRTFSDRTVQQVGHTTVSKQSFEPEYVEESVEQTTIPGTVVSRKRIQ